METKPLDIFTTQCAQGVVVEVRARGTLDGNDYDALLPQLDSALDHNPAVSFLLILARAIYWAAHNTRREVYVGATTSLGIKLNKLWPGALDHYVVGHSFGKTDEARDVSQPDNLWKPAPGEWAAHGPFDADASDHSWQMRASRHRNEILAGVAALGAITAGMAWIYSRRPPATAASTRRRQ